MDIRSYLGSPADIERDLLFCGIATKSRVLIHRAAEQILAREDYFDRLKAIDDVITDDSFPFWQSGVWKGFPKFDTAGGSFLLAFPILHHVADIRRTFAERGIPEEYLRELMADLERWIETYDDRTRGLAGFEEIAWLREHISCRMFQVGRLQFQPSRWHLPYTLLKNNASGAFALVAHGGDSVSVDGRYTSSLGVCREGAKEVVYSENADGYFGHRTLPDGTLAREPELFKAAEWTRYIADGDAVINIHIPSGAPLDPAACRASVRDAVAFFKKYFPDWPIANAKAMVCETWLLCPDFPKILPAESNILGFQKMFIPFPCRNMGDGQFYERAFVPYGRAVTRADLKTRLQFALFDHIAAGHVPLEGGGVIPLE